MAEPVRLLILDLDETFWRGTLAEGGVEIAERHKALVVELARRGIISSICSKNDPAAVEARLVAEGLWDYFILPSIDWTAKGPRIRALIETLGLRAAAVMFVDDIALNLEEARRFCPGLQIRGAEYLAGLLDDPLFAGRPDPELSRLKRYKLIERRQEDARRADADLAGFLRECQIEVEIDYDVEANIDRFVELINRTNQLNFTKRRLPEDIGEARRELRESLGRYNIQAALVRVSDRYGDHGLCGAYLHNSEGRRLEQFAFSCRILGLGVERWLYQKLGRPGIEISGEVLADLSDPSVVDWIALAPPGGGEAREDEPRRIGRVTARGSCDIGAILHYFRYHSDDAVGEYHIHRNGGVFRIDHSVFFHYAARGMTTAQLEAAARLGYVDADFNSRLFDPDAFDERGHLVLLSFNADAMSPLIRHRGSGLIVPFTVYAPAFTAQNFTLIDEPPEDFPPWAREAHAFVRAEWEYIGLSRPRDTEGLLRFAVERIPSSARICLIAFLTRDFVQGEVVRKAGPEFAALNGVMRAIAASHPNVCVIEVDDIVEDADIIDRQHFQRPALLEIYRRICAAAFASGAAGD